MEKRTVIAVIVAGLVVLALVGLWVAYRTTSEQAPEGPAPAQNEQAGQPQQEQRQAAENVTVRYTNTGFQPASFTIRKGGTLHLVNDASEPVQFSSDEHPFHFENRELNMDVLQPDESTELTLTNPGTWGFHNHLNPDHIGTLTVTP